MDNTQPRQIMSLDTKFTFGKYSGETFEMVCQENPSYIVWTFDEGIIGIHLDAYECYEACLNL